MRNLTAKWITPLPVCFSESIPKEIPHIIKSILLRRGLTHINDINDLVEPPDLPDPTDHFPDLDIASERIISAINNNEKIAICGDYDADGMTSTSLLVDFLLRLDGSPIPFIPSRKEEGYGLNRNIVEKIRREGIRLIITVDNGVSAIYEIELAQSYGIDVILSDHHEIKENLPNLLALIHPSTIPYSSPYKYLAGVGLAYLIAQTIAIKRNSTDKLSLSKDLFCIGTVADMAKLKGANRYWLKSWTPNLINTKSKGLKSLLSKAKLNNKNITTEDIAFRIAPRINSVGRISEPSLILKLFLEKDHISIREIVNKIENINKERKLLCNQTTSEAISILESNSEVLNPFIVLAQNHWHQGVIGIVAAKNHGKIQSANSNTCQRQKRFFKSICQISEIL